MLHHESNSLWSLQKTTSPLAYKMFYKSAVLFEERCGINYNDVIVFLEC